MGPARRTVRRATRDDAGLLAELGARTIRDTYASSHGPGEIDLHIAANFGRARMTAELEDPASATFLAFAGDRPCGYATIRAGEAPECVDGPRPVELARIYLTADAIGRGHGAALLRACLEEARRAGHETMWLGVWEENARAISFYRKWGFTNVGTHPFVFGGKSYEDAVMARSLRDDAESRASDAASQGPARRP
jgi:ribosomal protein S18 acetylase RimI-like enzyme